MMLASGGSWQGVVSKDMTKQNIDAVFQYQLIDDFHGLHMQLLFAFASCKL